MTTWTSAAVWDCLVEAADTLRRLSSPIKGPAPLHGAWPTIVRTTAESFDPASARARLTQMVPPTAAAIDRLDEALKLVKLDRR